jgi:hypothetical protein
LSVGSSSATMTSSARPVLSASSTYTGDFMLKSFAHAARGEEFNPK